MIPVADGGVSQQQSLSRIRSVGIAASVGSNGSVLTLASIKAPKNGYVYIYISNQSNNDVYFDNLQAGIVQGNIAEENHYYAFGLAFEGPWLQNDAGARDNAPPRRWPAVSWRWRGAASSASSLGSARERSRRR